QPYTASGVREVWRGACRRAGVIDATIKDLRGKAVTDARKSGYTLEEIQVAVAHTDIRTTQDYVKQREQPESAVIVGMPKK
ncbi:MAG TPA: tyrosine-type recombinase/integrase, partial [Tepidisphaeraceae bacterium]|nr:tyrosine-type recombinase/integrase [Tepidisphaeraceae bacterium]